MAKKKLKETTQAIVKEVEPKKKARFFSKADCKHQNTVLVTFRSKIALGDQVNEYCENEECKEFIGASFKEDPPSKEQLAARGQHHNKPAVEGTRA